MDIALQQHHEETAAELWDERKEVLGVGPGLENWVDVCDLTGAGVPVLRQ